MTRRDRHPKDGFVSLIDRDSQLWLLLHRLPCLADSELRRLQRRWLCPAEILDRQPNEWRNLGVSDAAADAFQLWRQQPETHAVTLQAQRDADWLQRHGACLLWPGHRWWPELLGEIASPPALLYVRGDPQLLGSCQLAIVGSRRASRLGLSLAEQIAEDLVGAGFAITSGLAYGIDAIAHRAALANGGTTLAILGTGLDTVYPRRHGELCQAIAEHGALVTEFPLGTPPRPDHFPRRNRLISGLSVGVLVIEAALRSGSLITARLALEQNREVFAVPGSPANLQAQGCNALLRDGAILVENSADVLAGLGHWWRPAVQERPVPVLTEPLMAVLALLSDQLLSMDALSVAGGLEAGMLSAMLLELELLGLVEQEGGAYRLGSG